MIRRLPRLTCWATLGVSALLAGCGADQSLDPMTLSVIGGDGQIAPAGARLVLPLTVEVRADEGTVVPRARVRWTVIEGAGAALSDPATVADPLGRAYVLLTLGRTPGTYRVRAVLASRVDRAVAFEVTATVPPALSDIQPATFTGGEVITLTGEGLLAGTQVLINDVPASVTATSPDGQSLTVEVPPCLVPGNVTVSAIVAGAPTNQLPGTFAESGEPVSLDVGQHASIGLEALDGCATFPAAGAEGREYLFVAQAAGGEPGVAVPYRLTTNRAATAAAPAPEPVDSLPFAVQFHDRLRALGAELAAQPREQPDSALLRAPAATIEPGHRRTFRVCNHPGCGSSLDDFTSVSARARYVGQYAAIFADDSAPGGGFTDTELATFGAQFDEHLYPIATEAFGIESDLDRNGVVIVLMSPIVNALTPEPGCEQSVITGFFFDIDIDPRLRSDPRSNQGEIFYTLVPDPEGVASCAYSTDLVRRVVPVVFIHEFQHMINFYQHVVVRGGDFEYLWLNEGLSHIAEELAARFYGDLGDQDRFAEYIYGNLFNAYQYLYAPDAYFLQPEEGRGTLAERGGAWLFLRWLADQYGEAALKRLVETRLIGTANVEGATGTPFHRLVAEWALAVYASDLPDIDPPTRIRYTEWRFRSTFQDLHEDAPQRFDRPFPLVPLEVPAEGFDVSGTLRAGSGGYYRVVQDSGGDAFIVSFTKPDGEPIDPTAGPRLTVLRLR